jgi:hypothetical protein
MMDVESYRQNAADCLRQAEAEAEPDDKNILLNVALAWVRLAHQVQEFQVQELHVQEFGAQPEPDHAAEIAEVEANATGPGAAPEVVPDEVEPEHDKPLVTH